MANNEIYNKYAGIDGFPGLYENAQNDLKSLTTRSGVLLRETRFSEIPAWARAAKDAVTSAKNLVARAAHQDAIDCRGLAADVRQHVQELEKGMVAAVRKQKSRPKQPTISS